LCALESEPGKYIEEYGRLTIPSALRLPTLRFERGDTDLPVIAGATDTLTIHVGMDSSQSMMGPAISTVRQSNWRAPCKIHLFQTAKPRS
jgi:hypothetical protein